MEIKRILYSNYAVRYEADKEELAKVLVDVANGLSEGDVLGYYLGALCVLAKEIGVEIVEV